MGQGWGRRGQEFSERCEKKREGTEGTRKGSRSACECKSNADAPVIPSSTVATTNGRVRWKNSRRKEEKEKNKGGKRKVR